MFRCAVIDLATGVILNMIIADPAVDPAPQGTSLMRVGLAPVDGRYKFDRGNYTFTLTPQDIAVYIVREGQVEAAPVEGQVKFDG